MLDTSKITIDLTGYSQRAIDLVTNSPLVRLAIESGGVSVACDRLNPLNLKYTILATPEQMEDALTS